MLVSDQPRCYGITDWQGLTQGADAGAAIHNNELRVITVELDVPAWERKDGVGEDND
jgi:hypothetical protein